MAGRGADGSSRVHPILARMAAALPDGWSPIGRLVKWGDSDHWSGIEGAPCSIAEAHLLIEAGIATTAQRRDPDGRFTLLVMPLGRPRA